MIRTRKVVLAAFILVMTADAAWGQARTLKVYGPSGPSDAMSECGRMFQRLEGVFVTVTAGPESEWIDEAVANADVVYAGAEYALTDLTLRRPDLVDASTRTTLYDRAAVVLVREGNPRKIKALSDLAQPGTVVMAVLGAGQIGLWEDATGRKDLTGAVAKNVRVSLRSAKEALERWDSDQEIDAWITFPSWSKRGRAGSTVVELAPQDRIYRGVPVVAAQNARNPELAQKFISFLKTEKARSVFRQWGFR